jgi:hypothetical protein
MMEFSKDVLTDWRKMADLDGLSQPVRSKSATNKGYSLGSETQTCAAALDKDHTHGDLLRHKGWLQQATRTIG